MTYQKSLLQIVTLLVGLLSLIPGYTSASSDFSFNKSLVPQEKPKAAVVEINADGYLAEQYAADLLLSMQNELLLNGMNIVIGKENATDGNTLVMNIDFSIKTGLLSHVRRADKYNYFVENISRVTYDATIFTTSKEEPFLELSVGLDTQILGLTNNGYDSIESIDSLFGRSANFLANLIYAAFSDTSDTTGNWHDMLGSTVVEIPGNLQGGEYTGIIKSAGNSKNVGFSAGEKAYQISSVSNSSDQFTGKYKVRYTNGREPEWLPAEYIFVGNVMIVKPILSNASSNLSFFIKKTMAPSI